MGDSGGKRGRRGERKRVGNFSSSLGSLFVRAEALLTATGCPGEELEHLGGVYLASTMGSRQLGLMAGGQQQGQKLLT